MTPAARAAAAIAVLDRVLAGETAEHALTGWGRGARYAGSGDRAAVRDIVFDALRCRRSFAALGGAMTGRGLVLGSVRARGADPALWFDGSAHGPAPVGPDETGRAPEGAEVHDIPDWLEPRLRDALGEDFAPVMAAMRLRAPVVLRVNLARATPAAAQEALAAEGVETVPHPLANSALQVAAGERRIQGSAAYASGLVELQDAASQAVCEAVALREGDRVLDLCAGGGGKVLALAARARIRPFAHDAAPRRMADLPARAARAGATVKITENPETLAPYDVIFADVPCSGSGSWRRDPEGKWRLTPEGLATLAPVQDGILDRAAALLTPGGTLAYATCSFLREENEDRVGAFLARHPGWACRGTRRFTPLEGGDGFFLALLGREDRQG